jgi:hypothetical protein
MPLTRADFRQLIGSVKQLTRSVQSVDANVATVHDAVLLASNEAINAITQFARAQEEAKKPQQTEEPQRVRATVDLAPEVTNRYYDEQRKSYRLQLGTFIATVATLIALVVYTFYTRTGADAALLTAQTNERIIKGSTAAAFDPTFVMSTHEGYIDISFQNSGKVNALNFDAHFQIARREVPGYSVLGKTQEVRIVKGLIPPIKPAVGRTVHLEGYSEVDRSLIEHMREVVSVEGRFQYDNGFGDIVRESICLFYVDLRNPSGGGSAGFMPCDDAKTAITLTPKR